MDSHSFTNNFTIPSVTANRITALDMTSIFTSLAANYLCGVSVTHNSIGQTMYYLGVKLTYV